MVVVVVGPLKVVYSNYKLENNLLLFFRKKMEIRKEREIFQGVIIRGAE